MDYVVLMIAGSALLAGAVAYGVTHRDFHAGGRAAAALACALLVGAASLYIPYLPVLALLGTYYAATDGVLMAMGSEHIPEALRGSGLASTDSHGQRKNSPCPASVRRRRARGPG